METIFTLNKHKNTGLFPQVVKAFDDSPVDIISTGTVEYAGLTWRFISYKEVRVSIYGGLVVQLPRPLVLASFESVLIYDIMHEMPIEADRYEYLSAKAQVSLQSPDAGCIYEIKIMGECLAHVNQLYRKLVTGNISPTQS